MRRLRLAARDEQGFTLIEVLVTLVIMAGIMIMITQVLTGARKTRDEIHNIHERQLAGPAILARMEADLRALYTYNLDTQSVLRVRDLVVGGLDADTLDFVSSQDGLMPHRERVSDPFLRGDVNEVGYRLRPRPGSDDFLELYRRESFGVDERPFEDGSFALLHDRVKGLNIEVFLEDGPDAEPEEAMESDEFIGLPARIEVELQIEMAPRLVREQLVIERRTITYHRVFRFPESLRRTASLQPVPVIPEYTVPAEDGGGLAQPTELPDEGGSGTEPETGENPFGGEGTPSGETGASGGNPFGGG